MANLGISEALDNLGNWITWEKAFGVQAASAAKQVLPATTCETMHISIVFFFCCVPPLQQGLSQRNVIDEKITLSKNY